MGLYARDSRRTLRSGTSNIALRTGDVKPKLVGICRLGMPTPPIYSDVQGIRAELGLNRLKTSDARPVPRLVLP